MDIVAGICAIAAFVFYMLFKNKNEELKRSKVEEVLKKDDEQFKEYEKLTSRYSDLLRKLRIGPKKD